MSLVPFFTQQRRMFLALLVLSQILSDLVSLLGYDADTYWDKSHCDTHFPHLGFPPVAVALLRYVKNKKKSAALMSTSHASQKPNRPICFII